jgi:glycerol-3-phosphate cytidylyltransferase
MTRVLTYGTFDLLHHGHIRILKRAKALGDYLVVAVSTDEFNAGKGKTSYHDYATRAEIVEAVRYVDEVIPERAWEQKIEDILDNKIDIVAMGDDWADSDKFDYLKPYCELVFLPRTEGVSTTEIKENLKAEGKLDAANYEAAPARTEEAQG